MLTQDNSREKNESLSFEHLLSWFGRFTPQLKFRLMGLRRQLTLSEFDLFIRETLTVFRALLIELGRSPRGPERARKTYAMIEQEYKASPPKDVSCAAGCGACCRQFPKQITDDEADLLAELVRSGVARIDRNALRQQAQDLASKDASVRERGSHSPCLFLGPDEKCGIYNDRPAVCRKYHVTSPKENCDRDSNQGVVPHIDLMPELIVSAAISLPDNELDFMPIQLAKRLL